VVIAMIVLLNLTIQYIIFQNKHNLIFSDKCPKRPNCQHFQMSKTSNFFTRGHLLK